jgi:hypothetical protein
LDYQSADNLLIIVIFDQLSSLGRKLGSTAADARQCEGLPGSGRAN